jgi:phenylacetate-CoA ligase
MPLDRFTRREWRSPDEIAAAQEPLLRSHAAHCAARSPFYRDVFGRHGIAPGDVALATLASFPPTDKAMFAARNQDFLAVPMRDVVDIALSSGTTGAPCAVMYSERDLERLAWNELLSFAGCGIGGDSAVLLTCTMDRCFVAGLAYQMGLRALGAAVIRNGAATLQSHADFIRRFEPSALVGVPTFLRKLAHFLDENGTDPSATSVRKLICIGEPLRDADMGPLKLGAELERLWDAEAYSTYATSETVSSFCECVARAGGHLHPDLAIVEIVDEAGNPLPPGEHGEVVITPLQVAAMPLLRFKTGDISFLIDGPCACGSAAPRLGPILGRKSQMIKYKGTTLYPQSILSALSGIRGITEYYVVTTSEDRLADQITVHAAVSASDCSAQSIAEQLQALLRVRADVVIEPEEAVSRQVFRSGSRKAVRFVDRRFAL